MHGLHPLLSSHLLLWYVCVSCCAHVGGDVTQSARYDAAGAARIIACEWNPNALQALRRNLELNGVGDRCQIVQGDCCLTAPKVILRKIVLFLHFCLLL